MKARIYLDPAMTAQFAAKLTAEDFSSNAPVSPAKRHVIDFANRQFAAAHPEIGELCRFGRPIFYVTNPTYSESSNPRDLV